jgi:predicted P-loop ATPase
MQKAILSQDKPSRKPYPILRGKDHHLISCQINAEHWLRLSHHADALTYDRFRQRLMYGESEVSDELLIEFLSEMEDDTGIPWRDHHLRNAVIHVATQHATSCLTAWLDGLAWDEKARLDTFFTICGAPADPYTAACARVLFLSAVARAYQPGCQADVMVVMIGRQGIGKSQSLISLVPDESWYTDDLGSDLHERRAAEGLQGKWLVEFSEFARINRATNDMVKSFISRRTDRYRPAYGRTAKDFPRQCIFIGTTNDAQPLKDVENRRFMTIECPGYFVSIGASERDQLWAEAVHRYRHSEPWWILDKPLQDAIREHAEEARQHDPWEEVLRPWLQDVTQTTQHEVARLLDIPEVRLDRSLKTRLGIALAALGFRHKRVREGDQLKYRYERSS